MVEKAGCDFAGFASLGTLLLSLFSVKGFNMIGSFMSGVDRLYGYLRPQLYVLKIRS